MNGTLYRFILASETPSGRRLSVAFDLDARAYMRGGPIFEPIDVCDSAIDASVFGGVTESAAAAINRERASVARHIAEQLASAILDAMKADDKRNGYPNPA